jgi:hypothetical protein
MNNRPHHQANAKCSAFGGPSPPYLAEHGLTMISQGDVITGHHQTDYCMAFVTTIA